MCVARAPAATVIEHIQSKNLRRDVQTKLIYGELDFVLVREGLDLAAGGGEQCRLRAPPRPRRAWGGATGIQQTIHNTPHTIRPMNCCWRQTWFP